MKLLWKEWKQKIDFLVILYEISVNNKILLCKIVLIVGLFISSMCFICDFVYILCKIDMFLVMNFFKN